jgi:hypothetical protein
MASSIGCFEAAAPPAARCARRPPSTIRRTQILERDIELLAHEAVGAIAAEQSTRLPGRARFLREVSNRERDASIVLREGNSLMAEKHIDRRCRDAVAQNPFQLGCTNVLVGGHARDRAGAAVEFLDHAHRRCPDSAFLGGGGERCDALGQAAR